MTDRSSCGCVWDRKPGFGDVVVQQCAEHAAASASPAAKAAFEAADRAVLKLRMSGKLGWPEKSPIDWEDRAKRIQANMRFWATPDPWRARRAATRTVDAKMTRQMIHSRQSIPAGWDGTSNASPPPARIPAGWDCSDYLELIQAGEQQ